MGFNIERVDKPFVVKSPYKPSGDQPKAIEELAERIENGENDVVLMGATGTGKTATTAWLIERLQRLAFFAADFVGMLDNLVKSAIQVDPFGRESIAHAGNAGDVVGGFATKRGKIRILLRRDVVFLHHRVGSHVLQIFEMMPRIQHCDVVVDELERVTIAG